MAFLAWIQDTAFSTWIRESDWAIFAFLIVHTIGMAFLAGTGIATMLRILGIASGVRLSLFARFVPVMVCGLITAMGSGVLLVLGYPAKALTNPVFYLKLAVLTAAVIATRNLMTRLFVDSRFDTGRAPTWARAGAALCLLLWIVGITAGKFLAYTNTVLLVY